MSKIIKKTPIDENLARCVAKLIIANKCLRTAMIDKNVAEMRDAVVIVKESMELFKQATKEAPESPGNSATAAYGVALLSESDVLCNQAHVNMRWSFRIIPGGKNALS